MNKCNLETNPLHLGLNAKATIEPTFTGMEWYAAYAERHKEDDNEGRLVAMHTMSTSWDMWEMHPEGDEVVVCLEGSLTLIQEKDGELTQTTLEAGECIINQRGVWHTADIIENAKVLFITAGKGTVHKPRATR